jgi:hypothetical protein
MTNLKKISVEVEVDCDSIHAFGCRYVKEAQLWKTHG